MEDYWTQEPRSFGETDIVSNKVKSRYRVIHYTVANLPNEKNIALHKDIRPLLFGDRNIPNESGRRKSLATYAIVDAAKVFGLSEFLETAGLECRCLYKGEAYEELKEVGPWLLALEEGHPFAKKLFTHSSAPWAYWGDDCAIFFRSGRSLNQLWSHFRKFLKLEDSGKSHASYFRFYDPLTLRTVISHLDADAFADFAKDIHCFLAPCPEGVFVLDGPPSDTPLEKPAPPRSRQNYFTPNTQIIYTNEQRRLFELRIVAFLDRNFAPAVALLSMPEKQDVARLAVARARERGIVTEVEQLKYLIPVMFWGSYFARDPLCRNALIAAGWLDEQGTPRPNKYLDPVLEQIDLWHFDVEKDVGDPRELIRGLWHLHNDCSREVDVTILTSKIREIWPRRSEHIPLGLHQRHVTAMVQHLGKKGLKQEDAALCAGLALYFGQGFLEDPRYPWATAALRIGGKTPDGFMAALEDGILNYWRALRGEVA